MPLFGCLARISGKMPRSLKCMVSAPPNMTFSAPDQMSSALVSEKILLSPALTLRYIIYVRASAQVTPYSFCISDILFVTAFNLDTTALLSGCDLTISDSLPYAFCKDLYFFVLKSCSIDLDSFAVRLLPYIRSSSDKPKVLRFMSSDISASRISTCLAEPLR